MHITATIGGGRKGPKTFSTNPSGSDKGRILDVSALTADIDIVTRTYRESGTRLVIDDTGGELSAVMLPSYY